MQIEDYTVSCKLYVNEIQEYRTFFISNWDEFPNFLLKDVSSGTFSLGGKEICKFTLANGLRRSTESSFSSTYYYLKTHWTLKYYIKRVCPNLFKHDS